MKTIIKQNKAANTVKIAAVALIFQAVIATSPVATATPVAAEAAPVAISK